MSHDVDEVGNATLVAAAEAAGVRRFVFVSVGAQQLAAHTPFTDAKRATEARIRSAAFESVIIRPDAFQEVWLSPVVGFDPVHATARIFGKGTGRTRFVGVDDVAEAIARIAVADTAPGEVILGGPEALSTVEAAYAFGRISGRPMKVSHVPRFALTVGSKALRSFRPVMASLMGMALETDGVDSDLDDSGLSRTCACEPVWRRLEAVTLRNSVGSLVTPALTPAGLCLGGYGWHAEDSTSVQPVVGTRRSRQRTVNVHIRKQQVLSSNLSVGSSPQSRSESPHSAANPVPSTCHNADGLLTERSSVRQGRRPKLHEASQRRRGSRPQSASHAVSDAAGLACAALDGNSVPVAMRKSPLVATEKSPPLD